MPSSDDVRDGTSAATVTDSVSKMFCRVCRPYEQTGAFVVGCSVFKKASIVAHEKSKSHQLNILKENAKNEKPGTSIAAGSLKIMNSGQIKVALSNSTCFGQTWQTLHRFPMDVYFG